MEPSLEIDYDAAERRFLAFMSEFFDYEWEPCGEGRAIVNAALGIEEDETCTNTI